MIKRSAPARAIRQVCLAWMMSKEESAMGMMRISVFSMMTIRQLRRMYPVSAAIRSEELCTFLFWKGAFYVYIIYNVSEIIDESDKNEQKSFIVYLLYRLIM